ncbi:MAG: hypothetical protein OEY31_07205 [Candidatus Bathyarchaeota archaeon]|nr:hypothetical protein [Candidatus Bathyarchaeota archaeon]
MEFAMEQTKALTAERASPPTKSLRLPTRSAKTPEGSSINILEKNQAEMTNPTRTPVGSSSSAKMGRKAAGSLMPMKSVKPTKISSK